MGKIRTLFDKMDKDTTFAEMASLMSVLLALMNFVVDIVLKGRKPA